MILSVQKSLRIIFVSYSLEILYNQNRLYFGDSVASSACAQAATTSDAHLRMLEELAEGARLKNAREDLLQRATALIHRLHSEKQVMKYKAEAELVASKDKATSIPARQRRDQAVELEVRGFQTKRRGACLHEPH